MKTTTISTLVLALVSIALLAADRASAAIIVVAPTGSTAGSFQITNDITFEITTAGDARAFFFDEWVTSASGSFAYSAYSPGLSISINNYTPGFYSGIIYDNFSYFVGAGTPNDGYLWTHDAIVVAVGDTVTLKAGSYSLAAVSNFNSQATQTFTGNMFITDSSGQQLSNTVAVPEPTTTALLIGGAAVVFAAFKRRK